MIHQHRVLIAISQMGSSPHPFFGVFWCSGLFWKKINQKQQSFLTENYASFPFLVSQPDIPSLPLYFTNPFPVPCL